VLDERARALARVPPAAPHAAEVLEVATFLLASEQYAIETQYVREVVRLTEYTPLPGSPPFLRGVMNLRGEILAIIDLRTFLGVPDKALGDLSRVLVLGGERAEFGVLADEAHEVRILRTDEVLEPPGSVAGVGREYLRGVTQEALLVLDGTALLQDSRIFVDQGEGEGQ
jgi:purine-binding chemotaxis protein CheW